MLGKPTEKAGVMEKETSEAGNKEETYGRNVESSWGIGLVGRQIEKWGGENRGQILGRRNREREVRRDGEREARRQGETGKEAETQEDKDWGAHRVPEVRGTRMCLWSQPSSSVLVTRGFKAQESRIERKAWSVWPTVRSPTLPGPPPTRLSRMQSEVEPLGTTTLGTPNLHRESGEQAW